MAFAKNEPNGFPNRISKVAVVGVSTYLADPSCGRRHWLHRPKQVLTKPLEHQAGGRIGKEIATALLKTGQHSVRALTRAGSTTSLPEGVEVAEIDYADESTIVSALKNIDFLVITLSTMVPAGTHSKLVRGAAAAGTKYVMPNSYGPDPANEDLMEKTLLGKASKADAAEIQELGMRRVVLSCSFWYEWSLGCGPSAYGFDLEKRAVTFFDDGNTKINTSTWVQCGRAVAALLSLKVLPEDEHDKTPTLSRFFDGIAYVSSFRVSQRDMFESVKRVTGTKDEDWAITSEDSRERWQRGMEALGKGNRDGFVRAMYSRVFWPRGGGDFETTKGLHNEMLGLSLDEDLDERTAASIQMAKTGELPRFG